MYTHWERTYPFRSSIKFLMYIFVQLNGFFFKLNNCLVFLNGIESVQVFLLLAHISIAVGETIVKRVRVAIRLDLATYLHCVLSVMRKKTCHILLSCTIVWKAFPEDATIFGQFREKILCDENEGTTLGETVSFPLKMKLIHVWHVNAVSSSIH